MDNLKKIKKAMHTGELYLPTVKELRDEQIAYMEKMYAYNKTGPADIKEKQALLKEMFAEIGEDCYIETPFYADWGGKFVHFGSHIYANFNLTLVDDTYIYVGDYTKFGPNVIIATAGHPINAREREEGLQYNKPVKIGRNCWIGSGAIILPGVKIGDNVVIGAGSVITKDLPDNAVAVGNPGRILYFAD